MLTRKERSLGTLLAAAKAGPQWSSDAELGTLGKAWTCPIRPGATGTMKSSSVRKQRAQLCLEGSQ